MADVTDAPFRQIIAERGKPDVMFTEFVSADGLAVAPEKGRAKLLKGLVYSEGERPIVAQFFTADIEHMKKAVRLAVSLGFDGVDINMGCPDRTVEKQEAGAALMKNPALARALIRAAIDEAEKIAKEDTRKAAERTERETAKKSASPIPISVKTRIGYSENDIETWLPALLAERPAAITLHARTRKEMSDAPAHWDVVKRAVEIRDEIFNHEKNHVSDDDAKDRGRPSYGVRTPVRTLITGNGDVEDLTDAKAKAIETGADGIMLGRAIFGNPWLFAGMRSSFPSISPSVRSTMLSPSKSSRLSIRQASGQKLISQKIEPKIKLATLLEHTRLFEKTFGRSKSFAVMKKHFKAYVAGWPGAADLRLKLMETKNADEVEDIIAPLIKK